MLRAALIALVLPGLVPLAAATTMIDEIQKPDSTAAGHPFDASVRLTQQGPAEDVVLFAALYQPEPGKTCGPSTDPRFKTFTQVVQQTVHLPADSTTAFPPAGERWSHRYAPDETPTGGLGEWCVLVARAPGATAQVEYLAYRSVPLKVRAHNEPPAAVFAWQPLTPTAAAPVSFHAEATDADGDPIAYRWDFGFTNASGRATATGADATARFFPEGAYDVTLVASDGFDDTPIVREVRVLPEQAPTATVSATKSAPTPLPLWVALAAVGLAMARRYERDPQ